MKQNHYPRQAGFREECRPLQQDSRRRFSGGESAEIGRRTLPAVYALSIYMFSLRARHAATAHA